MSNVGCCIKECRNSYHKAVKQGKKLTLYSFPSQPWLKERREIWIKFASQGKENADGSPCVLKKNWKICNEHFVGGSKSGDPRHPAYNPTIRNPKNPPKQDPKILIERYKRLVQRHNLKKQKEKELTEKEVTCSKNPETKTVTLNVPKGVKVLINQIDEHIEDHPPTLGLPSSQHEVTEEQPNKEKNVKFGPKQLTCLICCKATSLLSDKPFSENLYFQRFCRILYPFHVERSRLLDSLKTFSYLSICQPCLSTVSCVAVKKSGIDKCAEKVRNLQNSLIEELKHLQVKMEGFYKEIKKVEEVILEGDKNKLEEDNIADKHNKRVISFRENIVKNSTDLKTFGGYLDQKIRCDDKDKVLEEPDIVNLEDFPVPEKPSKKPSKKLVECYSNVTGGGVIRRVWDGTKWKITEQPPKTAQGVRRPFIFREDLRVECALCGKKIYKHFLQKHKQISCKFAPGRRGTGEKDGICHLCGKRFTTKVGLEKHVKFVHSEERPFLCTQCPYAAKTMGSLRSHEEAHAGLRSYVCRKGCGGGFRNGRNRSRHEEKCNGRGTPFRKKAKLVEPPRNNLEEECGKN